MWTAVVTEAPRRPPARFSAGLPPDLDTWIATPEAWPSVAALSHAVCTDQPSFRGGLAARLEAEPIARWGQLAQGCPDLCDWVVDRARADRAVAEALRYALLDCRGPRVAEYMASEAADDLVIPWLDRRSEEGGVDPEQVARVTRRALQTHPAPWHGLLGLDVLGRDPTSAGARALGELHGGVHPDNRDAVALAMWGREDRWLRQLHFAACGRSPDPRCEWTRPDPLGDLVASLADHEVDPYRLGEQYPTVELSRVLSRCAVQLINDDPWQARGCVIALARIDRASGLSALESATRASWDEAPLADVAAGLDLGRVGIAEQIEALGLGAVPPSADPVTVIEGLVANGSAHIFPQVDHGSALYRLADIAGLHDVSFAEIPADFEGSLEGRTPRTTLYAWTGDRRLRTLVDDAGGWWGFEYDIGLINTILEARSRPEALAVSFEREGFIVVRAPIEVLAELADRSLVRFEAAPQAYVAPTWPEDTGL